MKTKMAAFLLLVIILQCISTSLCGKEPSASVPEIATKHYNVIFIGATGDLARKHLWKALFNLFSERYEKEKVHFSIYACGLKPADEGREALSRILLGLECFTEACRSKKIEFVRVTQYSKVKTEADYKNLADKIADNTQSLYALSSTDKTFEEGRLVYFAIPPSAYSKTAQLVNTHLRPRLGRAWFRVVLEKPFGHDKTSAKQLHGRLTKYFKDEEIYRVDHYLGKNIVRLLLQFRYINQQLYEPLWNHQHIERVEIVMKELLDVKGRAEFYSEVGVIRDVMQNHLTELMTLVAMDLPTNSGNITHILQNKLRLLQQVAPLTRSSALIGQYSTYAFEENEELNKSVGNTTNVPTFAATLLQIQNGRWKNVPFILMSGKKLDEKSSHVRIVFKNNVYCVDPDRIDCSKQKQIVFHIGGNEHIKPPMIALSKGLPHPKEFPSWGEEFIQGGMDFFGEPIRAMHQILPNHETQEDHAYTFLLGALMDGQRHWFTNTRNLLAAWDIWTPLLLDLEHVTPRIYQGGKQDINNLDFAYHGSTLQFVEKVENDMIKDVPVIDPMKMAYIPSQFRNQNLVSHDIDVLIEKLGDQIFEHATQAINDRGIFHFAIPGGNSPKKLLSYLATESVLFPWQQTHIWVVDERCVDFSHKASNFGMIEKQLLQHIQIPYVNVHPMPIHLQGDVCLEDDKGDSLYEAVMKRILIDGKLDYVLLGLGSDGHTASLFPNQTALAENEKWVTFSKRSNDSEKSDRMTMTFKALNSARHISILVTGEGKADIVQVLSETEVDVEKYPVTGIQPRHGNMTWFIDRELILPA